MKLALCIEVDIAIGIMSGIGGSKYTSSFTFLVLRTDVLWSPANL